MAQDTPHGDGEPGRGADQVDGPADARERAGVAEPVAEQRATSGTGVPEETDAGTSPWARPGSRAAAPDDAGPGAAGSASVQPGAAQPSTGESSADEPGEGEPSVDEPGEGEPSVDEPGEGEPSAGERPAAEPDEQAQTTYAQGPDAQGPHAQSPQEQGPHEQSPQSQGAYAPNPYAQNVYGQAPYPQGGYVEGPYPQGGYVPGQTFPAGNPQGQYPAGQYPPGRFGAAEQAYATAPYPAGAPQYPGPPPGQAHPAGPQAPSGRGRTGRLVAGAVALALVAGGVGGAIGVGIAQSSGSTDGGSLSSPPLPEGSSDVPPTQIEKVSQKVLPSVVQIRAEGGLALANGEQSGGSGMVVSGDGLVLTNNHVIEPGASGGALRAVFEDGRTAPMRIIGRDPQSDLAVAKADNITGLTPVELGDSEGVRVGQQVTAFGAPFGLGGSVTTGIVSALNRAVSVGGENGGSSTVLSALQTDAAINPGNSGGPLVDMAGRVVGINSAIATAGGGGGSIGVGFSIPINQARRVADQLRTTGKATHPLLGVEVTDDPQQTGARVRTVVPDGPAARAGLKPNDLVVRLGNQPITTGTELQAAVRSQAPGATVELQLKDRTAQVTLGEN